MTTPVVDVQELTHRYGRTLAVDGLSLSVGPGEVYGLLGHNGAGKSTTIRCLLGLQKPQSGSTRVLGLDSWRDGVEIRRRCGYVPEDVQFYPWMTVRETLRFVSRFHPTWDAPLAAEMVERLELPLERRMKELSRGTAAKVALLCATAFRPDALLLDDPTSGLDAVVRREFLEHVIEVAAEQGRAVLFSSHVLDEVERIADRVGIIVGGRKVLDRPMPELKAAMRRVTLAFRDEAPPAESLPPALTVERSGRTATLAVDGWDEAGVATARALGATEITVDELPLEDIFVAVVKACKRGGAR